MTDRLTNMQLAATATMARMSAVKMVYEAASGHIGGSLSCMDILTTLYFDTMNIDPSVPNMENRDRFVLSKGHCSPALYSVLALRGFFQEERLKEFRRIDGHLSGHVEMRYVPGVDMSTGSLGQGLSAAVGMALAGKIKNLDYRVYALLGDGEIAEGQIWEALLCAAKHKLDNLCIMVDVNGLQIDGSTAEVMPTEPLDEKLEAFGMNVITVNGHDYSALKAAFAAAAAHKGCPTALVAKTIKGKGVSFMENQVGWHGKAPSEQDYIQAQSELNSMLAGMKM